MRDACSRRKDGSARIAPDDLLLPTFSKEIGAPSVTVPGDTSVRVTQYRAVLPIENAHLIAASLGEEIDGLSLIVITSDECRRIRDWPSLELSNQCRQPWR
jgi:hypothetical protein